MSVLAEIDVPDVQRLPAPVVVTRFGEPDGSFGVDIDLVRGVGRPAAVPALALTYRSAAANGPFGWGWALDAPCLVRGTGRRLPRYRDDGEEPDGFSLPGLGELVPELSPAGGEWRPVTTATDGVLVQRYRPRHGTGDVRVERHRDRAGDTHWRMASGDGVVRVYGRSAAARVADPTDPAKVAGWLPEEELHPLGHRLTWEYLHDEGAVYPARMLWGNARPDVSGEWLFELSFEYGDRPDAFSTHRLGFATRTRLRCERIRLSARGRLIRTLELAYSGSPRRSLLTEVRLTGHRAAESAALPPVRLTYTGDRPPGPVTGLTTTDPGCAWLDLDGTGLPGLITREPGGGLSYRANLGLGRLTPARPLRSRPALTAAVGPNLSQPFADGHTTLLDSRHGPGFQDRSPASGWHDFATFRATPVTATATRAADLDGDGRDDVLVAGARGARWHRFDGRAGWSEAEETCAPAVLPALHDRTGTIRLADMTGDGLADLVQVRPGSVTYWPNLGHGRFAGPVRMANAPVLATPDDFDPARVRLVDLDGTGAADLVYLGRDGMRSWPNEAGNAFGPPRRWDEVPPLADPDDVAFVDVTGGGTGCVVWRTRAGTLSYTELQDGEAPGLLCAVDDGRGLRTEVTYRASTRLYAEDRAAGRPWRSTAPFAQTVVTEVRRTDLVTGAVSASRFHYRHACYDDAARRWHGFGYVERRDVEIPPPDPVRSDVPPPPVKLTRTWLHPGLVPGTGPRPGELAAEFYAGDPARPAPPRDVVLDPIGVPGAELAYGMAGRPMREEVYGLDDDPASAHPRTVTEYAYRVESRQPGRAGAPPVVSCLEHQHLTRTYERVPDDPRTDHHLVLAFDEAGNPVREATVAYPRRRPAEPEQGRTLVTMTEREVVNRLGDTASFRIGIPIAERVYEVGPFSFADTSPAGVGDLSGPFGETVTTEVRLRPGDPVRRRLVGATVTRYWDDALTGAEPAGVAGARALPYQESRAVLSPGLIAAAYPGDADVPGLLAGSGHELEDGLWWARGPRIGYTPERFHAATSARSAHDGVEQVTYDADALFVVARTDAAGNTTTAGHDDWALAPAWVTDPNGSTERFSYEPLGLPTGRALMGDGLDDPTIRVSHRLAGPGWSAEVAVRRRPGDTTRTVRVSLYDGTATEAETRTLTDDGSWASDGRTVRTPAGVVVRAYGPYFTEEAGLLPEGDVAARAPVTRERGDETGRPVETEAGDGSLTRTRYEAWRVERWDANDAVLGSRWLAWRRRADATPVERAAGEAAAEHAGTPTVEHLDPAGAVFLTVADGGPAGPAATRIDLDIDGEPWRFTDARGLVAEERLRDLAGRPIMVRSSASGLTRVLHHADGEVAHAWGARGQRQRIDCDAAGRPTARRILPPGSASWRTVELIVWDGPGTNTSGRVARHFDPAGCVVVDYDSLGRPARTARTLRADVSAAVDWSALLGVPAAELADRSAPLLAAETLTTATEYDLSGNAVSTVDPDGISTRTTYDLRDLPVAVSVDGEPVLVSAAYDAAGNATERVLGNGVRETAAFEPATGRLTAKTVLSGATVLRDLRMSYDAVGNALTQTDAAASVLFYDGTMVPPDRTFRYDALDRLTSATGREAVTPPPGIGQSVVPAPHPADRQAVRPYTEHYTYDAAGNLERLEHRAPGADWVRLHDTDPLSDRLIGLSYAGGGATPGEFRYDEAGNPLALAGLGGLSWDLDERLTSVDLGGGGTAYYEYDAAGQRIRTVVAHVGGLRDDRIRLGGWSRSRRLTSTGEVTEETVTCEVDGLVVRDRRTARDAYGTSIQWRYQHTDHLMSVTMETGADGSPLNTVEFHPWGTVAYQAADPVLPPSEYRFRGAERDRETGLDLYGVRFYAPWLCRWISPDPAGMADGTNRYWYVRANPTTLIDPEGTQSQRPHAPRVAGNRLVCEPTPTVTVYPAWCRPPECHTDPVYIEQGQLCRPTPPPRPRHRHSASSRHASDPPTNPASPTTTTPPPAAPAATEPPGTAGPSAHVTPAAQTPSDQYRLGVLRLHRPDDPAVGDLPYWGWTPPADPTAIPPQMSFLDRFGTAFSDFYNSGGNLILNGGSGLAIGLMLLALTPVGWPMYLLMMGLAGSAYAIGYGTAELATSGGRTREEEATLNRIGQTQTRLFTPGGYIGGLVGMIRSGGDAAAIDEDSERGANAEMVLMGATALTHGAMRLSQPGTLTRAGNAVREWLMPGTAQMESQLQNSLRFTPELHLRLNSDAEAVLEAARRAMDPPAAIPRGARWDPLIAPVRPRISAADGSLQEIATLQRAPNGREIGNEHVHGGTPYLGYGFAPQPGVRPGGCMPMALCLALRLAGHSQAMISDFRTLQSLDDLADIINRVAPLVRSRSLGVIARVATRRGPGTVVYLSVQRPDGAFHAMIGYVNSDSLLELWETLDGQFTRASMPARVPGPPVLTGIEGRVRGPVRSRLYFGFQVPYLEPGVRIRGYRFLDSLLRAF